MTASTPVSARLAALSDLDVVALVGDRALRRGRTIFNNGGVGSARAGGDRLSARVRDRSSRAFQVNVTLGEKGLSSTCTCYQEGVCEHAAATLLAWTDARSSFSFLTPEDAGGVSPLPEVRADALWHGLRNETGSMTALLLVQRVTDLRKLAQRVGVASDDAQKEMLARRLAPQLGRPEVLAQMLAQLVPAQRIALNVLMLFDSGLAPVELERAARTLNISLDPAGAEGMLKGLAGLGLAFTSLPSTPTAAHWQPPLEVAATVAPIPLPLADEIAPPATSARGDLALSAYLRGLCMVLRAKPVEARPTPSRPQFEVQNAVLSAWHNLPEEIEALQRQGFSAIYNPGTFLTITSPPTRVSDAALAQLSEALGCAVDEVRFLLRLLDQLKLLETERGKVRLGNGVDQLLQLPALEQARTLAALWAGNVGWSELHDVPEVRLRRSLQATLYLKADQIYGELAAARRYVVRLVRTLALGHWWSLDSLIERAYRLHPRFLVEQRTRTGANIWQLTDHHHSQLDLMRPSDWKLVAEPFIREVVRGLAWLGIVTTDSDIHTVQITPLGAYLLGLSDAYLPEIRGPVLEVDADLRVSLDAAVADASVLGTLEQLGELEQFKAGSFRYRITPRSLRDALTRGHTRAAVQDFLAQHSRSPLPQPALQALESWTTGFGHVQLYNGLTLLELADELLLPELLRSTSLRGALLEQLSPTLLLIDPARSDALWTELVAKGYTPQQVRAMEA